MRLNQNLPDRKPNRIQNYDYSENGYYFITICLEDMKNYLLGNVIDGKMRLSEAGKMVEENLIKIPDLFHVGLDIYVIMPNHIHIIFTIENYVGTNFYVCPSSRSKKGGQTWKSVPTDKTNRQLSVSEIVQRFKTFTTNQYIKNVKNNNWLPFHNQFWQRSFYDHVVRVDESLEKIREYILDNPPKWEYDKNNPDRISGKYHFEY